jgi:hypothetical protein
VVDPKGAKAMKRLSNLYPILLLWLIWGILMVGYQAYVQARFEPKRPDYALFWTPDETRANSQNDKPYLMEPFLNDHVSWDSEYYLSIAVAGYDDLLMRAIPTTFNWDNPQTKLKGEKPDWVSMNYAFFPFYPLSMRMVALPLRLLGLNSIATATLAGVLVSMLGTLGAMLSLYDLVRDELGESGGLRAAYYLLIWPAGMFLAQVYTEGLFLGLSFGTLALARRKQWVGAALLAACATWTRAAGTLLLLPLVWYWWEDGGLQKLTHKFSWAEVGKLLLVASPLLAYLLWQVLLGQPFHIVEELFFSRGLLAIGQSLDAWGATLTAFLGENTQGRAYYLVEFAAILFGFTACGLMLKKNPLLVIYSLITIVFSMTSGVAQGMHRYVMAAPVIFMLPARWGQNRNFDRAWTLGNILIMGIFAAMFSFDFWAG